MKILIQTLLGFCTALFIICTAVVITLNAGFLYEADIDRYNLEESTGLSREEIKANYQAMIDYNNLGGPETLEFPTFSMSESGRIHFEEVRRVFYAIEITAIVTGIITAAAVVLSIKKKLLSYRLASGAFTVALPLIAGVFAVVAWDRLFVLFHQIVFNNNYWIFDPAKDPVITILPDGYFLHCLVMIVVIAFAGAAAFFAWYFAGRRVVLKKQKN